MLKSILFDIRKNEEIQMNHTIFNLFLFLLIQSNMLYASQPNKVKKIHFQLQGQLQQQILS